MTEEITISDQLCQELPEAVENELVEEMIPEELTEATEENESEAVHEEESIDALKEEIVSLKTKLSELEALKEAQARLFDELSAFRDLFPEVELNVIPESVWDEVRKGSSLTASYALYEKRMEAERARIALINASNASKSPGVAGRNTANEYFSPDEVRKMSRTEVHANYSKIKESMKKWI